MFSGTTRFGVAAQTTVEIVCAATNGMLVFEEEIVAHFEYKFLVSFCSRRFFQFNTAARQWSRREACINPPPLPSTTTTALVTTQSTSSHSTVYRTKFFFETIQLLSSGLLQVRVLALACLATVPLVWLAAMLLLGMWQVCLSLLLAAAVCPRRLEPLAEQPAIRHIRQWLELKWIVALFLLRLVLIALFCVCVDWTARHVVGRADCAPVFGGLWRCSHHCGLLCATTTSFGWLRSELLQPSNAPLSCVCAVVVGQTGTIWKNLNVENK